MITEKKILEAAQDSAMTKHVDMSYSAAHEAGFIAGARWAKEKMEPRIDELSDETDHKRKVIEDLQAEIARLKWAADEAGEFAARRLSDIVRLQAEKDSIQSKLNDANDKIERLRDALQSLYDEQNGPPQIRREKQWQAAMEAAEKLLGQ